MVELLSNNIEILYGLGSLLFFGLIWLAFAPDTSSDFDKRLKRVSTGGQAGGVATALKAKGAGIDIRLKGDKGALDKIVKMITPNPELLKNRLMRTGFNISLSRFALICALAAILSSFFMYQNTNLVLWLNIVIGSVIGFKITNIIINFLIARREKKFITRFPDAIDLMVRGIKSGLPLSQTVQSIAGEVDGPVGVEFQQIADSIRLGTDLSDAIWERAKKLDIPELKFFCIALSIQQETGGNLAETLSNLATILRRRKQVKLKIKAMSSEAKASAIIIGSLPFVMYLILKLLNPEYVAPLLNDPRGINMVIVGLVMIGLGAFVMTRLVKFEI